MLNPVLFNLLLVILFCITLLILIHGWSKRFYMLVLLMYIVIYSGVFISDCCLIYCLIVFFKKMCQAWRVRVCLPVVCGIQTLILNKINKIKLNNHKTIPY